MRRFLCLLFVAVFLPSCGTTADIGVWPDLIVHNGKVFTANQEYDFLEAVAVRDGTIVAVGENREMLRLAGAETRLLDLEDRTMVPGFFDNHVHLGRTFSGFQEWEGGLIVAVPEWIERATTIEELQRSLQIRADETPEGEWITGALSREVWPNQTIPDRHDLDTGTSDHPVLLTRGPHTTVLNSKALELAGINRRSVSPGGGEIPARRAGRAHGTPLRRRPPPGSWRGPDQFGRPRR